MNWILLAALALAVALVVVVARTNINLRRENAGLREALREANSIRPPAYTIDTLANKAIDGVRIGRIGRVDPGQAL